MSTLIDEKQSQCYIKTPGKTMEDKCEVCGFTYNIKMLIGISGQLMCGMCVKQHVACLEAKIENLTDDREEIR